MEVDHLHCYDDEFDKLLSNLFSGASHVHNSSSESASAVVDLLQTSSSGSDSGEGRGHGYLFGRAAGMPSITNTHDTDTTVRTKPKRFRERQKDEIASLQQRLLQIHQHVENLAAANQHLRVKNRVLTQTLDVKECVVENLGIPADDTLLAIEQHARHKSLPKPGETECYYDKFRENAQVLSPNELVMRWKAFVKFASKLLLRVECETPDSAALEALRDASCEIGANVQRTAMAKPESMRHLLSVNVEENRPEVSPAGHWDKVLEYLNLTSDQVQECLALLEAYNKSIDVVIVQRQRLLPKLPRLLDSHAELSSMYNTLPDCDVMELDKQLTASLNQEYQACYTINATFLEKTLCDGQFTRAAIYAYPYFPDALAILNAVADAVARGAAPIFHPQLLA